MKKLQENRKYLDMLLGDLRLFVLSLVKKWLLWIFLILDVIALIIQYIYPNYKLPQGYYIGFAILGIVWSSFQVYRDLLNDYKKISLEKLPEKLAIPNLDISFVEGSEYKFSIDNPYDDFEMQIAKIEKDAKDNKTDFHVNENGIIFANGEVLYFMPNSNLEINFRIENTGDIPIDILDIRVGETPNNYTLSRPIGFGLQKFTVDSKPIRFPLYINTKDVVVVSSKEKIMLGLGANNAKFAAEFQALPKSFQVHAKVETLAENGKKKIYQTSLSISWRPLIDLYVTQWKHYSQTDYLRLAGF